jgi:alpha-mannosidase
MKNTSWDQAKFETCMQGYADLSEGDYGVAVTSDNKYGVCVRENEISLAVQKGALFPDETAEAANTDSRFCLVPLTAQESMLAQRYASGGKDPLFGYEMHHPTGSMAACSMVRAQNDALIIEL